MFGVHVMVCPFAGGYEASAQRNRHREDLLGSQKEQEERIRAKAQVGQDNQVVGCVKSYKMIFYGVSSCSARCCLMARPQ